MNFFSIMDSNHFDCNIKDYENGWIIDNGVKIGVLTDKNLGHNQKEVSWSDEQDEIHKNPTKDGWIDVYERKQVLNILKELFDSPKIVTECGASFGYMLDELKKSYSNNFYCTTDIMPEGLKYSYSKNPDVAHVQCDFTDAPFNNDSIDIIYALNVLEHISEDKKAINEFYRVLKKGGYCLLIVPRGEKLYDYFDEMLFHKRRYAKGELRNKVEDNGFEIIEDYHYAWLCYPAFWLKKKLNRVIGKRLTKKAKMERTQADINNAMSSSFAIWLMKVETRLSRYIHPSFGVREIILCRKN